ncbi:MAG: TatD family hydrolase, partial [Mariprofundaceae bacterium]|nr:TatD family hydrolase [Mariprofundaceae bacterium]
MQLFDTHCHIDFEHFDDDRDDVFARMRDEGVSRIVAVAVELEQTPRLMKLVESRDNVWFSVGVHPNHEVNNEPTVDQLCEFAKHDKCVAVGESGMDFFRAHVDPKVQEQRFRTHIRAAHVLNKPVIVHMRDADEATLRILKEENITDCGGIMHCFSSNWEAAKQALDMGMSISFSGNVTFKRNDALREVAAKVPAESILIETDSPYLAPVPMRGKRNEPTFVKHVA